MIFSVLTLPKLNICPKISNDFCMTPPFKIGISQNPTSDNLVCFPKSGHILELEVILRTLTKTPPAQFAMHMYTYLYISTGQDCCLLFLYK